MKKTSLAFDFDDWANLAQRDPDGFEQRRVCLIEDAITQAPPALQPRLRGLQFRVDMERRRARTPMASCVRLSRLMWDSVVGEDGLRDTLNRLAGWQRPVAAKPPQRSPARILPFGHTRRDRR